MAISIHSAGVISTRYLNPCHIIHDYPRARIRVGILDCRADEYQRAVWRGGVVSHRRGNVSRLLETIELNIHTIRTCSCRRYKYTRHYKDNSKTETMRMCDGTRTRLRCAKQQEELQHVTKHKGNKTKNGNIQRMEKGDATTNAKKNDNKRTNVKAGEENGLGQYKSSCADSLDPALKTNTADPQSFVGAAASPVYGPHAYLEGSPGTNRRASGTRWA